jgi:hypothetical protein
LVQFRQVKEAVRKVATCKAVVEHALEVVIVSLVR